MNQRADGQVKSNIESMHEQMKGILSVLTPMQQAKFLIWVEEGMNGSDIISSVHRVLQMQNRPSMDDTLSMSLSENESLSSLSNLQYQVDLVSISVFLFNIKQIRVDGLVLKLHSPSALLATW